MNVSFLVPARNKAGDLKAKYYLAKCIDSVLAQSYSPMELVFSDQGSTDETLDIIRERATAYDGPNEVRILQCPDLEYFGMAGFNRHWNWLHQQIAGDIVIGCAADDYNEPERTEHIVAAFRRHNPSYVGTRVRFVRPGTEEFAGETEFPDRRSRWIGAAEAFHHHIISSMSGAWARDLWDKYGPLRGIESQDVILPSLALCERGIYYIDQPLHTYVMHADLGNTGCGGQVLAARDEREHAQLVEVHCFHNLHHWVNVAARLEDEGLTDRLDNRFIPERSAEDHRRLVEAAKAELQRQIRLRAQEWTSVRESLTLNRIEPRGMRV